MQETAFSEIIQPLLELPVSRYIIPFEAEETWRIYGTEASYRGRLGWRLKQVCCPFVDFREKDCEKCQIQDHCLYPVLFSPNLDHPQQNNRKLPSPRPFVFSFKGETSDLEMKPGQRGMVRLTFFGPAIKYAPVMMEAAAFALASYPVQVKEIIPDFSAPAVVENNTKEEPLIRPLLDWVTAPVSKEYEHLIFLRFITPVTLKQNKKYVQDAPSFLVLVQTILRRLRDLKRAFYMDGEMGKTRDEFFEAARTVNITINRLQWKKRKRHSSWQNKDVYLNGLRGEICYTGSLLPFYPLIRAGEIIHVGKGTSCGNGRIQVISGQ